MGSSFSILRDCQVLLPSTRVHRIGVVGVAPDERHRYLRQTNTSDFSGKDIGLNLKIPWISFAGFATQRRRVFCKDTLRVDDICTICKWGFSRMTLGEGSDALPSVLAIPLAMADLLLMIKEQLVITPTS